MNKLNLGANILTKLNLIQPIFLITHINCRCSHMSVLQHDKLIKQNGSIREAGSRQPYGVGLTKDTLFSTPCSVSIRSLSIFLQASYDVKLLFKHDP